ncbi:helix-turn-helix domain-containing protein [Burkholderia multivorans]|uniref:helix-turn-helix domain-containing protein n=1 Tax=Burkholderia multivorans TaxID=87883 RepID=UPI002018ABAA|nr:helix-turn-helix transcriptional regulator [Burkholderia multivorans]MCO1371492.1 helix-turn-helix domain-containing protein [Burkholderia multivorans]MCO1457260.1 helix-turn-helix domain-containing protein [Burkholderia multivorans]MCO1466246.1 helix-turn-helix domain-containing protein [Burkholderia multivorans]UQO16059.1 helix-turn-helix domain-containing protein [Burkholderia multivorans]UQO86574.1 helix-turn-helix domain-containing protein [Burkholderia multivorans]
MTDPNHDIVPTLRMFDGVMTGLAADEIERLRKRVAELEADAEAEARLTDEPSLTNPLTPYGMLVRALRIVSGTTLMDMAKALLTTPAKLSAMEFGRAPVTPEFAFDVAAYFDALGVPCTESALRAAARAQGGEKS